MSDVIEQKINAVLGHAENPEEALDLCYEKLLDNLQRARRGVADVLTAEKRLELQADQLRQEQARLQDQARRAVEQGRDDLARLALTRAQAAQSQLTGLDQQIAQLKQQEQHLEEVARKLQAKVEAFRTQKETIKAQYSAAEASARIGEAVTGLSEEMGDVNLMIERAQDKTAQMQARSAAIDQLVDSGALDAIGARGGGDDIERQLQAGSAGTAVDDQLAALKHQLARAGQQGALPGAQVVVRIQGEGQYAIPAETHERLDRFDGQLVQAVEAGDEASFRATLAATLEFVRSVGEKLAADQVRPSETVLPSPNMTLAEARSLLEQPQTQSAG